MAELNPAVSEVPAGEDQTDHSGLFDRAKAWFKECRSTRDKWEDQAKECYAFYSGDQWDEADRQKLRDQLRPCITFNRLASVVNSVTGSEVSNRQEVRYIPREMGDSGVNEVLTAAAEWVRDECDAADEESDAFGDLVIGGMGWTDTRLDYEVNPDGKIVIERVDPFEVHWDHRAKKRNLDDAKWVGRVKVDIDLEEAKAMFPGHEDEDYDAKWAREYGTDKKDDPHNQTEAPWYKNDGVDDGRPAAKRVTVVEVQWWERATVVRVADPQTGQIKTFHETDTDVEKLHKRAQKIGLKSVKQQVKRFKRAFIGAKVLEVGDAPSDKCFTLKCMTGYRDRNQNVWVGLLKAAIDPQRWANKWLSQTLHIMNSGAKGGVMAEEGAFANIQKAEADWSSTDKIIVTKPGALSSNKIIERKMGQMPTGFEKAMEWGIVAIRDSTGVNVEFQGATDRQQAGVLEYQRKQAAMTVLATLFDGLKRYRKEQGRLLLYMIQKYISDDRLIRLVGEDGNAQYIPLTKQPDTIEYDVIVDDAPSSPNMKERVWATLQPMMQQLAEAPPSIWAEIIKYSPLPESLTVKISQILSGMSQQGNVPPEVQKTLEDMGKTIEKLQQENMQLKDKKAETQQQLQIDAEKTSAEIQLERTKLEAELQMEWQKLQAQLGFEREKLNQEKEMGDVKMAQEREKHDVQIDLTKAKANATGVKKTPKKFKIERDEKGDIIGATVEEHSSVPVPKAKGLSRKIKVERDANGNIIGGTVGGS